MRRRLRRLPRGDLVSGYVHCACPDCFETAISGDDDGPAMCSACEEYECDGEHECLAELADLATADEWEEADGIDLE